MTDEDVKPEETVETPVEAAVEPAVEPVMGPEVTPEPPVTEPETPAIEPEPEVSAAPLVSEHDRAYFRQWLREDARWIATELELHQTCVPVEDRPLRNP